MMKKTIKNPELYAHKIRASFKKFLGYYQHNSVLGMEKEKMRRKMVDKAKKVIQSSNKEISTSFPGNKNNQTSLRLVRLLNKEKEIESEGKKIRSNFKKLMQG